MNTRSENVTADNGAIVQIGTVTHNGADFTALGGVLDFERGYAVAYVDGSGRSRGVLTLWNGERIGTYSVNTRWLQYGSDIGGYTMESIRAKLDGDSREWYGRYNADWSQAVALRPYK